MKFLILLALTGTIIPQSYAAPSYDILDCRFVFDNRFTGMDVAFPDISKATSDSELAQAILLGDENKVVSLIQSEPSTPNRNLKPLIVKVPGEQYHDQTVIWDREFALYTLAIALNNLKLAEKILSIKPTWLGGTNYQYLISNDASPTEYAIIYNGDVTTVDSLIAKSVVQRPAWCGDDWTSSSCITESVFHTRMGSPLHLAVMKAKTDVVELLLTKYRADVNVLSSWKMMTPLYCAIAEGNYETSKLLIQHGANPSIATQYSGRNNTPLGNAIIMHRLDLVKLLLDAGANPNQEFRYPRVPMQSPLMVAALEGFYDSISYLLHKGADKSVKDEAGHTAYDYALANGASPVILALLKP